MGLCLFLLLSQASPVWAQDAESLLLDAEQAYSERRLRDAEDLASKVLELDPSADTAAARRLLVEIALREGDLGRVEQELASMRQLPGLAPQDQRWLERAYKRVEVDRAEQAGELPQAYAMLRELTARPDQLHPTELVWATWAETRLNLRTAELYSPPANALEELARTHARADSPEAMWLLFARVRVENTEAESRCDWAAAQQARQGLPPAPSDPMRAWQSLAFQKNTLRRQVQDGDLVGAAREARRLSAQPGLAAREQLWAEGYALWTELLDGGESNPAAQESLARWKNEFPNETGCEAPESTRRPERKERTPSVQWLPGPSGGVLLGVGPSGWMDDMPTGTDPSRVLHGYWFTAQLQAWGRVPLAQGRRGWSNELMAGLQATTMLDSWFYSSGDAHIGLYFGRPRLGLALLTGVQTASVSTKLASDASVWCAYENFCPKFGGVDTYERGVFPVGYLAAGLSLTPNERLSVTLQLGGGLGPKPAEDYRFFGVGVGRVRVLMAPSANESWLKVGVEAHGVGVGLIESLGRFGSTGQDLEGGAGVVLGVEGMGR